MAAQTSSMVKPRCCRHVNIVHENRVRVTTNLTPQLVCRLYKLAGIVIVHKDVPQISSLLICSQCGLESLCKYGRVCVELLK